MRRALYRISERGAGTLLAVMMMFLIMAMMAIYANRSLVFEQRIASNYVRSGTALEMADAGVEWTMAQLNGGDINAACTVSPGSGSFRQRYLLQDAATRSITLPTEVLVASCTHASDQSWNCQCPKPNFRADGSEAHPSFGIKFEPVPRPGVLRIVSVGCTSSRLKACMQKNFGAAADQLLGTATVRTELALLSALKNPPTLALTHAGQDPAVFRRFFGMPPDKYRDQPAMRQVSCDGDCSTTIAQAYAAGSRMVWIKGPLILASNLDLGRTDSPILIIADGAITLDGPMTITGLIYARGDFSWNNGSAMPAQLNGALISEGALQTSGAVNLTYQPAVMDLLHNATGSFVRVPGSWSDSNGGS
ncbi:MAG TPA: PilX N-terminal domain-containing pilus assembly protein [Burkholderiaceae bacterium]|jgi:hypothetical protein